jgi:hypothetical protein
LKRIIGIGLPILAVAAVWAAPLQLASAAPVEGLDASVEVTTPQEQIAPAGNLGVFTVEVSLTGPLAGDVVLTDTVTGGAIEPTLSNFAPCGGTAAIGPTGEFNCTIALDPAGATASAELKFVVRSGLTASSVLNQATVSLGGGSTLVGLDVDGSNDASEHSVPVTSGGAISYVPEGGSIGFAANNQSHVLTVVDAKGAGGGAIVSLTDPGQMNCGAESCNGVRVVYFGGEDGAPFEALTHLDSSGFHDPCRGLGTDKCTGIFWRKLPTDTMAPLPQCGTEGPAQPCLLSKFKSHAGRIHYLTQMDSDDPDIGMPGIPTNTVSGS